MSGEKISMTPQTPEKKPFISKENRMLGSDTQGVPEFENMNRELNAFAEAVDSLRNFHLSAEWIAWKSLENEPVSEARNKVKSAVVLKLAKIDEDLQIGGEQLHREIKFYLAELARKE
jgi:hypothetical protein